ncbi:MAG: hypothetical protein AAGM22_02215 [Acidobacteriota bacterium]
MEEIPDATEAGPDDATPSGLNDIVGHGLLSGLCPLIPIPFLDDWLRDVVRRHLVRRLAVAHGQSLEPAAVEILACGYNPTTARGCVEGCLRSTVMWPFRFLFRLVFKKILRKLVFVLAIKDSVDTFSATFHEAYLIRHAFLHLPVDPNAPAGEWIAVRRAVESVRDEVDHRPIERLALQTIRGSRRLLGASARRAAGLFRKRHELDDAEAYDALRATEAPELDAIVDELTEEIRAEEGYLKGLVQRLEARWRERPSSAEKARTDAQASTDLTN